MKHNEAAVSKMCLGKQDVYGKIWKEVERPVSCMYENAVTEPMTFLAGLKINTYSPRPKRWDEKRWQTYITKYQSKADRNNDPVPCVHQSTPDSYRRLKQRSNDTARRFDIKEFLGIFKCDSSWKRAGGAAAMGLHGAWDFKVTQGLGYKRTSEFGHHRVWGTGDLNLVTCLPVF